MAATADSTIPSSAAPTEAYRVVARRYRPQRFDELVGQEHVARGLSGAIESGRIGHAYLFTGARGVGKTSAARIFAKALECATGPAAEPCNQCDTCAAIAAGQDVDVVEIDAASNRGIDEIRSLRQNVAVRPARGRFKIYIIDEVHMLSSAAFNALLKTLEEPGGGLLVLITAAPEQLLSTIRSRCQAIRFSRLSPELVQQVLDALPPVEPNAPGTSVEAAPAAVPPDPPELLDLAAGSPGALLFHRHQWRSLPAGLADRLRCLGPDPVEALHLARDLTEALDGEQQLWLLGWWQWAVWRSLGQVGPQRRLERLRGHLRSFVQPRLAWEVALLELAAGSCR